MAETTVTVAASTSGRLSAGGLYGKRLWHHVGCGRPHIDPDPAELILHDLDCPPWEFP